ncbi:MAG: hypothetical protein P4L83_21845 [Nevskia sp.]|nr:hypothetical protein [Nevskia sp.]
MKLYMVCISINGCACYPAIFALSVTDAVDQAVVMFPDRNVMWAKEVDG